MSSIRLDSIMSLGLLEAHIKEGTIHRSRHPHYSKLAIYSYSPAAAFGKDWDEVLIQCRGLITESRTDGEFVIARGFNKFFNLNTTYIPETMEENLPKETPIVTTKLDGSLGIIFKYDGKWHVATKGSFRSDQAQWATKWLYNHTDFDGDSVSTALRDATLVCEIIYPANRIVVNYGDYEGLTVLGIIDNVTGLEYPRRIVECLIDRIKLPLVPIFNKSLTECIAENNINEEGYVLTYPDTQLKIKVKFADYVRLHKILTGLSTKGVWELLAADEDDKITDLCDDKTLPKEFRSWLEHITANLLLDFDSLLDLTLEVVAKAEDNGLCEIDVSASESAGCPVLKYSNRKDLALFFQAEAVRLKLPEILPVAFGLLDIKNKEHLDKVVEMVWKLVKPVTAKAFNKAIEAEVEGK
jgi:RNA ligase